MYFKITITFLSIFFNWLKICIWIHWIISVDPLPRIMLCIEDSVHAISQSQILRSLLSSWHCNGDPSLFDSKFSSFFFSFLKQGNIITRIFVFFSSSSSSFLSIFIFNLLSSGKTKQTNKKILEHENAHSFSILPLFDRFVIFRCGLMTDGR